MAKKCIPGLFCIENMTLFVLIVLGIFVIFLWYRVSALGKNTLPQPSSSSKIIYVKETEPDVGRCNGNGTTVGDPFSNAYVPPIRCDSGGLMSNAIPMNAIPMNAIPINIQTQRSEMRYSQVGIITKKSMNHNEVLPLMGRRTITSRDKWQYYTILGGGSGGNLQTKLPVRVKGKLCSGEYGCDEIFQGDVVYVEGIKETFEATIYESGLFSYIPY